MSAGDGKRAWWAAEPYDPDVADAPAVRTSALLVVIAIGGMAGAAARYGAGLLWPTAPDAFPWTTFWINVVGCGLMGVLMVLVAERFRAHPLVRPLLGTGVLGGFTTFSTYAVDLQRLFDTNGAEASGLIYAVATVLAAVAAVWLGVELTRRLVPRRRVAE